jgi:hypothetical protein
MTTINMAEAQKTFEKLSTEDKMEALAIMGLMSIAHHANGQESFDAHVMTILKPFMPNLEVH